MLARRILLGLGLVSIFVSQASAQAPSVLYTWPSTTSDWFKNFGGGTGVLSNSGGALQIAETSGTAGTGAAWSDGFNTGKESYGIGSAGGVDLTGLASLQFDMGHNGSGPINVQFFTQATPGSNFVALGPDIAVAPGMATYTLPVSSVLSGAQQTYMRTIGINIRDHTGLGNVTWNINEVRSAGTPLSQRVIADHDGGATDFDGIIANFDAGAIAGGNGGQNNSGMSVVGGAVQWTDLGGGPGAAVTWGNGTPESGGSFSARPVDLSNYDTCTIRMSATGADSSVFVQYYMQTGSGFSFQAVNFGNLPVDGQFHDVVVPLASITGRDFVDTNGINLGGHASDLVIRVDSVIYDQVPEPASATIISIAAMALGTLRRRR